LIESFNDVFIDEKNRWFTKKDLKNGPQILYFNVRDCQLKLYQMEEGEDEKSLINGFLGEEEVRLKK